MRKTLHKLIRLRRPAVNLIADVTYAIADPRIRY